MCDFGHWNHASPINHFSISRFFLLCSERSELSFAARSAALQATISSSSPRFPLSPIPIPLYLFFILVILVHPQNCSFVLLSNLSSSSRRAKRSAAQATSVGFVVFHVRGDGGSGSSCGSSCGRSENGVGNSLGAKRRKFLRLRFGLGAGSEYQCRKE